MTIKKMLLALISIAMLFSVSSVFAAQTNTNFEAAQTVIQNWFTAMKDGNVTLAASYLAPNFISLHTDGVTRDKAQEVALIKDLNMKFFMLADFHFSQTGNVMMVSFKNKGAETIDSKAIGSGYAGRLATLENINGHWLIVGYANLDMMG